MLHIDEPFHGAVLSRRHGREGPEGLGIEVTGRCPAQGMLRVNGQPVAIAGGRFRAPVLLTERDSTIVAEHEGPRGRRSHTVRVLWDRGSFPRYRVCLDDVSFSLRELAVRGCGSIWDSHFLALLRRLHESYGTKFTVNLYYEADDGFTLAHFPARYRAEWAEASDWMGLTFHAYADQPDRPYQYAPAERLLADLELVRSEVLRFAGAECWIPPTVLHWGMATRDALRAMASRGVRALSGYFGREPWGYDVHYWLEDERAEYLHRRGALMDWDLGIVFSRIDMVVNSTPLEAIVPKLEAREADPERSDVVDLLTHEQYFFPHYANYIPDHAERLERAIRWVTDHGYAPVFFHEGLLGNPDAD